MGKAVSRKPNKRIRYVAAFAVVASAGLAIVSASMGESEVPHVSLEQESQNIIATTEGVSDTMRQRFRTERTNGDCMISRETYQRASADKPYIGPPQVSIKPCEKQ